MSDLSVSRVRSRSLIGPLCRALSYGARVEKRRPVTCAAPKKQKRANICEHCLSCGIRAETAAPGEWPFPARSRTVTLSAAPVTLGIADVMVSGVGRDKRRPAAFVLLSACPQIV